MAIGVRNVVRLAVLGYQTIDFKAEAEVLQQISALSLVEVSGVSFVCIGEWVSNAVKILDCENLDVVTEIVIPDALPRSIYILNNSDAQSLLLVGSNAGALYSTPIALDASQTSVIVDVTQMTVTQIGRTDVKFIPALEGKLTLSPLFTSILSCPLGKLFAQSDELAMIDAEKGSANGDIAVEGVFLGLYGCQSVADVHLPSRPNSIAWTQQKGEMRIARIEQRDESKHLRWTTLTIGAT